MLMTRKRLTEQAERLLEIVQRANGQIVTRSDIAKAMDKTRLNVWDVKLLDDLIGEGYIVGEKKPIKSPIGYEWQYRVINR